MKESAVRRLLDLRRKRLTAVALSEMTGVPRSTIVRLKGIGNRITGDRRSRNCGIGWEFVHAAIDNDSRPCPDLCVTGFEAMDPA
jgi:hypothetical protein